MRSYTLIHGREIDDFAIICFGSTVWRREHWDWLLGGTASISNAQTESHDGTRYYWAFSLSIFENMSDVSHTTTQCSVYTENTPLPSAELSAQSAQRALHIGLWSSVLSLHREYSISIYGAQYSVCIRRTLHFHLRSSMLSRHREHSTSVYGVQYSVCIESTPLLPMELMTLKGDGTYLKVTKLSRDKDNEEQRAWAG